MAGSNHPSQNEVLSVERQIQAEKYAGSWFINRLKEGRNPNLIEETRDPTASDVESYTYPNGIVVPLYNGITWLNQSNGNIFELVNQLTGQWELAGGKKVSDYDGRIINLETTTNVYEIFEVVGTTATGSITIPDNSTIITGRYGLDASSNPVTALVLELSGGYPIDVIARDSLGDPITVASINTTTGEYVLSATPLTNVAFVYHVSIQSQYVSASIPITQIIEKYVSQSIVKYGTVAVAEAQSVAQEDLIYVYETETFYQYTTEVLSRDGIYVLNNADGTKRKGVAGYFSTDISNYRMVEPTGFSRMFIETEGDISFDQGTRTFTIQPQAGQPNFSFMIAGKEFRYTTAQTFVISDVTGGHFIYFDTDGLMHELVNPIDFDVGNVIYQKGYVTFIYWNATTGKGRCHNERHGNKMDGETHANLHFTRGTQYISGCEPSLVGVIDGTGSLDSDIEIAIADGLAADEDLPLIIANGSPQTLSAIAQLPVFYLTGNYVWDWDTATNFPVKRFGTGRLAYNNFNGSTWEQLQVPNNQFVLTHVWGTNDILEPVIVVQGQATYNTINNARNGASSEINNLILTHLPSEEFFPIATFICQTSDSYSNTVKARLRSTNEGTNFVDWRRDRLSPATVISIHNNLSNRDAADAHPSSSITHTRLDAVVETSEIALQRQEKISTDSMEPTGYSNRFDSTMTWDHPTRTMSIQPSITQYDYWVKGYNFVETTLKSKQISTVNELHFIYFDETQTLIDDEFPPTDQLLKGVAFSMIVYWNNTQGIAPHVGDERHGMVMDWADHSYKHFRFGAVYISGLRLSGFTIGDGSLDSHAQFACEDGVIYDEDIEHDIVNNTPQQLSTILQAPVFYRIGTDGSELWYRTEADNFPIIYSGKQGYVAGSVTTIYTGANSRPAYNQLLTGSWQLTEIGQDDLFLVHLFATNDIYYPIIAILGSNLYTKEKDAQDAAYFEIQGLGGLPFVEFTPIGSVIYQGNNTFTNSVNARVVETDVSGQFYIDFRDAKTFKSLAASIPSLTYGDYTPTLTNVANVAASTTYPSGYQGIGTRLIVTGEVSVTTTAAVSTSFRLTLPVASLFGFTYELNGEGQESTGLFGVSVLADTTNHEALFTFIAPAAATYTLTYTFGYVVQ